jgi:hypothetical protein
MGVLNPASSSSQRQSFSLPASFISLRLERVDSLGAIRIPSETGILSEMVDL